MTASSKDKTTSFPVSIHFGIPIPCESNKGTPFQDATGKPTVTMKVDRVRSDGERQSHYFFVSVNRKNDRFEFNHHAEISHGGNSVRFYGNTELFRDFEMKSDNFCETVEFFDRKEDATTGDSLRFAIAYFSLLKHFGVAVHPAFNDEQRSSMFAMRQVVADAYNCCQVNRSEGNRGWPCNLKQGYVVTNNSPKTIENANQMLRRVFCRFSSNELTNINEFCGNILSTSEFGTVYSYDKGLEYLPACYPLCLYEQDWKSDEESIGESVPADNPTKVLIDGVILQTLRMNPLGRENWTVLGTRTFNGNLYYGIDDGGTVRWINRIHCKMVGKES